MKKNWFHLSDLIEFNKLYFKQEHAKSQTF